MAFASVDVNLFIDVFAVAVDDMLTVKLVVVLKRIVCPKSISMDGQLLLLVVVRRSLTVDSSADFAGTTYQSPVPRSTMMKTGGLSCLYDLRPRGDRPRVLQRPIALAALQLGGDVHFVNLSWSNEDEMRHVERLSEALQVSIYRLLSNIDFPR